MNAIDGELIDASCIHAHLVHKDKSDDDSNNTCCFASQDGYHHKQRADIQRHIKAHIAGRLVDVEAVHCRPRGDTGEQIGGGVLDPLHRLTFRLNCRLIGRLILVESKN